MVASKPKLKCLSVKALLTQAAADGRSQAAGGSPQQLQVHTVAGILRDTSAGASLGLGQAAVLTGSCTSCQEPKVSACLAEDEALSPAVRDTSLQKSGWFPAASVGAAMMMMTTIMMVINAPFYVCKAVLGVFSCVA